MTVAVLVTDSDLEALLLIFITIVMVTDSPGRMVPMETDAACEDLVSVPFDEVTLSTST